MKITLFLCILQLLISNFAVADAESLLTGSMENDEDPVDDDNREKLQSNNSKLVINSNPHSSELTSTTSSVVEGKQYYQDRERGWFWYEAPKQAQKKNPKKITESIAAAHADVKPQLTAKEILRDKGKKMEEAMATAMLNPTRENYLEYMRQMNAIQEQSMQFANGFTQVLWNTPDYDRNIQAPSSPQGRFVAEQQETEQKAASLSEISKKNGLIFFFRSDCPFCHRFAPILVDIAKDFGFDVIPVSLDGGGLPEFPNPKMNNELGKKLKVQSVPAVFLVNPKSNMVSAVSYGFNSRTAVIDKILAAASQFSVSDTKRLGDVR